MQTESPLGAEITLVPPGGVYVCVFVGPCFMELGASQVGTTQRQCPGAESRTFLCRDLTKGSAISFDSSCSSLVFQPTCSLG